MVNLQEWFEKLIEENIAQAVIISVVIALAIAVPCFLMRKSRNAVANTITVGIVLVLIAVMNLLTVIPQDIANGKPVFGTPPTDAKVLKVEEHQYEEFDTDMGAAGAYTGYTTVTVDIEYEQDGIKKTGVVSTGGFSEGDDIVVYVFGEDNIAAAGAFRETLEVFCYFLKRRIMVLIFLIIFIRIIGVFKMKIKQKYSRRITIIDLPAEK